jgi:chromodomain-helicase-DNA-binding protein 7
MLASLGSSSAKTCQFNNIDIQLRKCCNHLFLLKGVQEELEKGLKTDEEFYKRLLEGSGKLVLLDKFIEKYKEENHKVLVFSQFKGMIDIIA